MVQHSCMYTCPFLLLFNTIHVFADIIHVNKKRSYFSVVRLTFCHTKGVGLVSKSSLHMKQLIIASASNGT